MRLTPKVSVIIPVYNTGEYLNQCLDSLLNQTLQNIEIICVDDGSTDNSLEILRRYCEKDRRMNIISVENKGAGAARNIGLEKATGEYLSFLDADDFFEKNMLESLYNSCIETGADIAICNSDRYDNEAKRYFCGSSIKLANLPKNKTIYSPRDIKQNIFKTFVGWAWDKLFKRSFISEFKLRFQEQRTTNDLYFVYSALIHAKSIIVIDEILVHQRVNLESSLSVTRHKSWDCFYSALLALKNELVNYNLFQEYERDFVNYSLSFSLWNLTTISSDVFPLLCRALSESWFSELGICGKADNYFYSKKEYYQYSQIMSNPNIDLTSLRQIPLMIRIGEHLDKISTNFLTVKLYLKNKGIIRGIGECTRYMVKLKLKN